MKKIYNALTNNFAGVLQKRQISRLFVKPVTRQIKRQWHDCLKQGEMIFKKLQEIDDSIEIIARQIARQIRAGE